MANYQLGPVIGQLGGGLEVVEQQIATNTTVSIPSGWGSAYAGFQGDLTPRNNDPAVILGRRSEGTKIGMTLGGFEVMAAGQNLAMTNVAGTLTFIRID